MPGIAWYRVGTASIANGATAVTGISTAWINNTMEGDSITFDNGASWHEIGADPTTNTAVALRLAYPGTTVVAGAYAIRRDSPRWSFPEEVTSRLSDALSAATHILQGSGAPSNSLGVDGDMYFTTVAPITVYGPKAAGVWPAGTVIQAPGYAGTSTTSNTIGLGSKTWTTQAGLGYVVGGRARMINSTANWMEGQITAYNSGTGSITILVDTVGGSGTLASWSLTVSGERGSDAGDSFKYAISITDADPGLGTLRFNSLTYTSISQIFIDDTSNAPGNPNVTNWIYIWDDANATADRGKLVIRKRGASHIYIRFTINNAHVMGTGYTKVQVTRFDGAGTFADGDELLLEFYPAGAQGPTGSTGATGAGYGGTSTTSLAVGLGTKAFTTQAGLAYVAGQRVRAINTGTPANFIEGQVASYSGTALTITADEYGGSGTIAAWTFGVYGDPGVGHGDPYKYSTAAIVAGDPGAGKFQMNSLTIASVTTLWIDDTSAAPGNPSLTSWINSWDDFNSTTTRGHVVFQHAFLPNVYAKFRISSAVTNASTYRIMTLVYVSGNGTFVNDDLFYVQYTAAGATGATGPGYLATSATSLAIGLGSKSFTVASGLAYTAGQRVRAVNTGTVTNYMEGVVASYSSTTLTVTVDKIGGSGTIAAWSIYVTGDPGVGAGMRWTYDSSTTMGSAPAAGAFRTDTLTGGAAVQALFHTTNFDAGSSTNWLGAIDDSTTTANRAIVIIQKELDQNVYVKIRVTAANNTGVANTVRINGTILDVSGTFTAGDRFLVTYAATGDAGAGTGDLQAANNLSELTATAATARANLLLQHETDMFASARNAGNLFVRYASVSTITISCSQIHLLDSSGNAKSFASVSETVSIASSGAGGLDTGSEAGETWYYAYLIGKADGTIDGMFSLSATAPTMPATYIYKALVSVVRNGGTPGLTSTDFAGFVQRGGIVNQLAPNLIVSGAAASASFASVSLANIVPPEAVGVVIRGTLLSSSGTGFLTLVIAAVDTAGFPRMTEQAPVTSTTAGAIANFPELEFLTAQTVWYRGSSAGGAGTGLFDITVSSWRLW